MADQITSEVATIKKLHTEILELAPSGLEKALQIGEMLTDIKGRFTHGNWTLWVEAKLPFDKRQAQRYMQVYAKRELYKAIPEINLTNALKASKSKTTEKTLSKATNKGLTSKDAHGVPITKEALPYWQRKQEVQDLMTAVSNVRSRLRIAAEEKDPLLGWIMQRAEAGLSSAYANLSEALPYAVCTVCQGHPETAGCTFCHGTGLISKYKYDVQADRESKEIRLKAYANRPA